MFDLSAEERRLLALIFLRDLLPVAIREQIASLEQGASQAEPREDAAGDGQIGVS